MRSSRLAPAISVALATAALAVFLIGSATVTHQHSDGGPGIYNPECQGLALATLGAAVALVAGATALAFSTVQWAAASGDHRTRLPQPRRRTRARAPPAPRA
jgi:hypothetical protein